MDKLISQQAAIEALDNYCNEKCEIRDYNWCPDCQYENFKKVLMALPSAQPKPCEDAVSREAVLSMIDTYMNKSVELHYLPTSDGIKKLISILPSVQPDTTTHESIPAETGENDGDRTSGDCISRTQAIYVASGYCHPANISTELAKLPTVYPDIIRCKDCKFYTAYDYTGKLMCKRIGKGMILPKPEDYCSYAERITDGRPN